MSTLLNRSSAAIIRRSSARAKSKSTNSRKYASRFEAGLQPHHRSLVSKDQSQRVLKSTKETAISRKHAQQIQNQGRHQQEPEEKTEKKEDISTALQNSSQEELEKSDLLAPVNIPDDPYGVIPKDHPSTAVLSNSAIIIQRKLELANLIIGFEQANKYTIMDPHGNTIGYILEQDHGVGRAVRRQAFRTHRSFTAHVFDKEKREVLRFHRPFAWISSRIKIYDTQDLASGKSLSDSKSLELKTGNVPSQEPEFQVSQLPLEEMRQVGEAQQQWAPLRRKYNLFLQRPVQESSLASDSPAESSGLENSQSQISKVDQVQTQFVQFAAVDEPFLSWDFSLKASDSRQMGSVNRNFAGFGRELFTDTGVYALRMDSAGGVEPIDGPNSENTSSNPLAYDGEKPGMTLDQRAVMLATAVSIDFDYFSRHSNAGPFGMMPLWMPWGGGAAAEAGEAGAEVGAAEGVTTIDGASPTAGANEDVLGSGQGFGGSSGDFGPGGAGPNNEDVWGTSSDPWSQNENFGSGFDGDGEGKTGIISWIFSWFE